MVQPLGYLKETVSQTAGPYVHIGLTPNFVGINGIFEQDLGSGPLYEEKTTGERITIKGHVIDGMGAPLRDALIEIWQADAKGLYNSPSETGGKAEPGFRGWGRCPSHMDTGEFTFETIKPAAFLSKMAASWHHTLPCGSWPAALISDCRRGCIFPMKPMRMQRTRSLHASNIATGCKH